MPLLSATETVVEPETDFESATETFTESEIAFESDAEMLELTASA